MWVYHSQIGDLFIKQLDDGRFGFLYNGTVWESCSTPQAEADNIFCHVTGCSEWDNSTFDSPSDLSGWENV